MKLTRKKKKNPEPIHALPLETEWPHLPRKREDLCADNQVSDSEPFTNKKLGPFPFSGEDGVFWDLQSTTFPIIFHIHSEVVYPENLKKKKKQ